MVPQPWILIHLYHVERFCPRALITRVSEQPSSGGANDGASNDFITTAFWLVAVDTRIGATVNTEIYNILKLPLCLSR